MVTALPELPPPTNRLADLTEPEQFVLGCFRRWLAGPAQREILWRTLSYELDSGEARTALKGLEIVIRAVTAHAHRNVSYHQPCCPCVGGDEIGLLTLVTAVQREQPELARLVARNFVHAEGMTTLLAAASVFAAALKRADVELPLRFG